MIATTLVLDVSGVLAPLDRALLDAGFRALRRWFPQPAARELVTTLFERYAGNPTLSRAEALRQASLAVMEGSGQDEVSKRPYSYAHPLFWAPYALVGDGGR